MSRPDLRMLVLAMLTVGAVVQVGLVLAVPPVLLALAGAALLAGLVVWQRRESARHGEGGPVLAKVDVSAGTATLLLVGLLVAALVLRLITLLERPTWADEMWTLRNIYTSDPLELLRVAFDDYWPPLYYLMLNTLARIADTSLLSLRLPSVLAGVATVAVLYRVGTLLFGNRFIAIVAAALLTGLTSHVLYSQEARVYALQVMLAVISAFYFYRSYWQRRISPAFILSTFLLTWSHSFASWYFVAGQCVYVVVAWLIWRDREALKRGVVSQVIVFLLWLPLIGFFLQARFTRDIVVPTYWATGERAIPGPLAVVEQYQGLAVRSWAGAAFMVLFLAMAIWAAWRWERRVSRNGDSAGPPNETARSPNDARAVVFLLCWIIVPVLFSLLVTVFTSLNTFGEIRYHLTVAPALCLLTAAGFGGLRTRAELALGAAVVILLPIAELPRYYGDFTRDAVDEAAALVRERSTADERIYVGNAFRVFTYYFRGFYPRIGSAQWDSLAAAHAGLGDRPTLESPKHGDTYAYEMMPERVVNYEFFRDDYAPPFARFIEAELSRGGLRGSFWIVLDPGREERVLNALARESVPCRTPEVYRFHRVDVIRCNPPEHADGG